MKQRKWSLGPLISLAIIVAAGVAVVENRQTIADSYASWSYEPPADVELLRNKLALTNQGELYFNASRPQIDVAATFNDRCKQQEETNNPILGCYVNQRIYVYDIESPKLAGIEETTAAHELLHAAYDRLDANTKEAVNVELKKTYDLVKTPELEERMRYYEQTEPGEEMNELHSILGTEFNRFSQPLEAHYGKYFQNRARIVEFHEAYNGVFLSATSELDSLETQINDSTTEIDSRISAYNAATNALQESIEDFNERSDSGDFNSRPAFEVERNRLQIRQIELDNERQSIEASIASIKSLRDRYNELVEEYNGLNRSINSSIAPAPSL